MQIYAKSIPYSNRILKDRINSGVLLDVGGAECPQRANALVDNLEGVVILDPQSPIDILSPNVTHLSISIEELSPEYGLFDHVLLSNVLEHLDDPSVVLSKVKSVMKPGGAIHILSPNCESLNRRIGLKMGVLKDIREIPESEFKLGHKHALTVGDIRRFAGDAELVIDECRGVFLKPVPTPEMIKWSEERIAAFFDIAEEVSPELCHEVYFKLH